jgi:glycosyltransferase involved in cell wall biosynthesis
MPKILRIINRFNLGGPTYNAAYLTKYMPSDYETLLIGGVKQEEEGSSEFIVESLGIKPLIIEEMQRNPNVFSDIKALQRIKKIIQDFKPDIVHTHASKSGALGRIAAAQAKVPVIVHTFHGHVFENYFGKLKTNLYINIEQYLAKKSSAIIAISDKQKYDLTTRFNIAPEQKVHVVPLGFDLDKFQMDNEVKRLDFRKMYHLEDDEIAIGIIGRLTAIKNHNMFVDVIKKAKDSGVKKIRAFVIGDGEEKESIKTYLTEKGLTFTESKEERADVTFTSWIKEIDWANAGLDIILLTSLNEGTPVSLIEAQSSCKPILSTRVGGVENTVKEGVTALLSESEDVETMSNNLIRLLKDDELREKMGKNGWELVKQKFHYMRLVSDMDRLYSQLLGKK